MFLVERGGDVELSEIWLPEHHGLPHQHFFDSSVASKLSLFSTHPHQYSHLGIEKKERKKKKEKKKRREKGCWSTVAPSFNLFLWCPEVNIFLDGSENVKSQTVGGNGNFFLPPFLLSVISFFLSLSFLPSILPSFHLPGHLTTYPGNTETLQLPRNRKM